MILPLQKLTREEKLKRHPITNKNNIEETADYYISMCNWGKYSDEIYRLYLAVEGHIDQEEYKTVQNPYNKQKADGSPAAYNAVLKNFNILKGVANLLMGEFGRRTHEYLTTSANPSDEITYKDGLDIVLKNYTAQAIANTLDSIGLKLGQQVQELPPLETYIEEYKATFDETRLISGQEILDYIKFNCDLDNKYLDLYWDWIVTGGAFTYKTVNHDDVEFEVVPRDELYVPNERHSRYIEDRSFAVRRQLLPIYKVVDKFRGNIDEEIIDALESEITGNLSMQYGSVQMTGRNGAIKLPTLYLEKGQSFNNINTTSHGVELFHVVYKTWKRYGVLEYLDEFGFTQTMEVGEDYVLNKKQGDVKITWEWENQLYEVWKCLDYYLYADELKENRADLNQNGLQKLPYNGIEERSISGEIQSLIKDGLAPQRAINVLRFQVEKLVNKNKDKLLIMPYGLINRKGGMSTKDVMYNADATSILWVDETAPNAAFGSQMIKSVDMGLGNYIQDTIELIRYIKQEYWETIGMNAQRYSNIGQGAGKGVTEQAIIQSAIITYELTRQFDSLIEKDYQGLLDISKLAYINGKKAKYIRSDGSTAFLEMNEDGAVYHSEASYNVFVKDASLMTEAIQAMKGQAVNLIQNGGDMAVLGHLYNTNNVAKLTKILEKLDKNKKEYEQLMEENKAKNAQALQDSINANDEANREIKKYEADSTYAATVESARIRSSKDTSRTEPRPANEVDIKLANHKIDKENKDLELKAKQIQNKNNTK